MIAIFVMAEFCTAISPVVARSGHDLRFSVTVGPDSRTVLVHLPPEQTMLHPAPLVMVFHGREAGVQVMRRVSGLDAVSNREGFIVMYLEARGDWNHPSASVHTNPSGALPDDIAYSQAAYDLARAEWDIDRERTMGVGYSTGGLFLAWASHAFSPWMTAIALVSSSAPSRELETPSHPLSVFVIHGTKDPRAPFFGGGFDKYAREGYVLAASGAAAFWRQANACAEGPFNWDIPRPGVRDGCGIRRVLWEKGKSGTAVVYYAIIGGGHAWPNAPLAKWLFDFLWRYPRR